jgi:hypothetical protein
MTTLETELQAGGEAIAAAKEEAKEAEEMAEGLWMAKEKAQNAKNYQAERGEKG